MAPHRLLWHYPPSSSQQLLPLSKSTLALPLPMLLRPLSTLSVMTALLPFSVFTPLFGLSDPPQKVELPLRLPLTVKMRAQVRHHSRRFFSAPCHFCTLVHILSFAQRRSSCNYCVATAFIAAAALFEAAHQLQYFSLYLAFTLRYTR